MPRAFDQAHMYILYSFDVNKINELDLCKVRPDISKVEIGISLVSICSHIVLDEAPDTHNI